MQNKSILIDLYMLKYPNCGFGQIAVNYAKYFKNEYKAEKGIDIYLLVPSSEHIGKYGNNVKYVVGSWYKRYIPQFFKKFDLWHSTNQKYRFFPYSKHTKYLLTIHDFNYVYEKQQGFGYKRAKYLINKLIDKADKIIFISKFSELEFFRFFSNKQKQTQVIYNGVEAFDSSIAKKPISVADNENFFFTIGEMRKKKNFHVLLDMMKLMPEKKLYIAGNPSTNYANFIIDRIKNENISNVVMLGRISNEERIWLYKNCEAFCFPSLFEGFGLPVIEAMQFGKPVFSSTYTSLKEIGGEYAYFWKNFEAPHMTSVVNDGLLEWGKNPALAVKSKEYAQSFSYKANIEAHLQLYRSVLNTI